MLETLESVNSPYLGFQADMAHTLLYTMGYNYPEHRLLPEGYDWEDKSVWKAALKEMTDALRPWTIDFHVAQNDATVFGSGSQVDIAWPMIPTENWISPKMPVTGFVTKMVN